jgi:hypothetical protein
MSISFERGIWVLYGDYIARTGATNPKGGRVCIEILKENNDISRAWVKPASITALDEAIQDLLTSIYIY